MIKSIICIIFLILIIRYQSIIYHNLVSFPRLYFWINSNGRKSFLENQRKEIIESGSTETYFDNMKSGNIYNYMTPIFDNALYLKKEIPCVFHKDKTSKKDSLPYIINMFTTPHNLFGEWIGDTIFRTDFNDRGKDNKYKEIYMEALKKDDLEKYRITIKNNLSREFKQGINVNFFDFVQKICIDLTYLLHFGFLPTKEDYKGSYYFIESVRLYYLKSDVIKKQINNLPSFYKRTLEYIKSNKNHDSIVFKWKGHLSNENIFMEFIHNILGMAINWTNLTYKYILHDSNKDIPDIPSNKDLINPYLYECIRFTLPVRFTSSFIKKNEDFNLPKESKNMFIHDFKIYTHNEKYFGKEVDKFNLNRMLDHQKYTHSNRKCPFFNSPKGAKVACGTELLEKPGYLPFGEGYRRCPGEHLTLVFLEELSNIVKYLNYNLYLREGKSIKSFYIWGEIEKNFYLKITK